MTVPPEELRLAADFPAATAAQWRELALGVLRKSGVASEETGPAEVDRLLSTTTYDGIRIAALYTEADDTAGLPGQPPFTRGARPEGAVAAGWDVRQRHAGPDPGAAREAILADLANGATSVWLVLGRGGLPVEALPDLLDGVYLDLAGIALDAGDQFGPAAAAYLDLVASAAATAQASGTLGADPLGWQARTGEAVGLAGLAPLAARCAAELPGVRAITVDATAFHDAGGGDAQELGCALAAGVAYLRALTDGGLGTAAALGQLEFRYAATADQFGTIAKLRAARRLWARVAQVCGEPAAGAQRQHAVTSAAMMSARDPWVNLLRGTLACFGAGVGGADAVTVLPFDHRLGLPDGLARRLARNTQTLLVEEANVARVVDPAGGSWFVERLTEDLARAAWDWFTEIERAGGLAAALAGGLIADRLAATWERRSGNLARRRDPLTGVSEFPRLDELLPQRQPAPERPGGGLPQHHYAEAFERLRDRADAHPGGRPTVFLATLGSPAAASPRVMFAANLFAAGGIATVQGGPAAFAASGAGVACLCGPDKAYPEQAAPAAATLREAGARRVWLAGRGEYDGIGGRLYTGCDAVSVLSTTLDDLEVAP
jgi:methylmalonyl-CoA mutase